jgi:DNA repair exonuclease SbcCD nuclease subunit
VKFIACNDIHLASRPPASRTDNYHEELFDLLDQMALLAKKVEAKALLIAGDVFHHKAKIGIPVLIRLVEWSRDLRQAGIRVLTIPGNHDLLHNRYETLDEQALGLIYSVGAMENVSCREGRDGTVTFTDSEGDVNILGIPFPDAFDWQCWMKLPRPAGTNILMAHCFASPTGGEYFGEPVLRYDDLAQLPYHIFVFGHDHSDGGVHKIAPKLFVNLGAISRGSLTGEVVERDVKCALIDTSAQEVRQVRLKFRPASEIFDLKLKAKKDAERAHIEQFVEQLTADLLSHTTATTTLTDRLSAMDLPQEVRSRVAQYIEAAEQPSV